MGWDEGGKTLPDRLESINVKGMQMLTTLKAQMQELGRGQNLASGQT